MPPAVSALPDATNHVPVDTPVRFQNLSGTALTDAVVSLLSAMGQPRWWLRYFSLRSQLEYALDAEGEAAGAMLETAAEAREARNAEWQLAREELDEVDREFSKQDAEYRAVLWFFRNYCREPLASDIVLLPCCGQVSADGDANREALRYADLSLAALPHVQRTHASDTAPQNEQSSPQMPVGTFLDLAGLTHALGLPPERETAVRGVLNRMGATSRTSVDCPRKGEPATIYRIRDVWPCLVEALPRWK